MEVDIKNLLLGETDSQVANINFALLKELEARRHTILKNDEFLWKQKSRATWLKEGDNNTDFFHHYASFRKKLNTIWEIQSSTGEVYRSFEDIANKGVKYFQKLYKEKEGCSIKEILKVLQVFPKVFSDDMNKLLDEEVTKVEVYGPLSSMKKGKSPGPGELVVELFL